MKYGCIGEHLSHSFSAEIHPMIGGYPYELCEVSRENLDSFLKTRDFSAVNVTIPYKQEVIPYLCFCDAAASEIGAVNTVVNRPDGLYGYNTDFYGMTALIKHAGMEVLNKKALILGTGGTSKTAHAVLKHLGAREILKASRTKKDGALSYLEIYERHTDIEIIINTTPVGMFPNTNDIPIDISKFTRLSGLIDAVYNPISTPLVIMAKERGIPAEGGLYMLISQAVRASEIFFGTQYPPSLTEEIYKSMLIKKQSIVLTGMPASGKSTVGKMLADELSRDFYDTDELIVKRTGFEISDIFRNNGEAYFRELECEIISELSSASGAVIATGGGAVLRSENISALRKNGRIYFLDRSPALLIPTSDRPLSSDRASLEKRYKERYEIYKATADAHIKSDGTPREICDFILKDLKGW